MLLSSPTDGDGDGDDGDDDGGGDDDDDGDDDRGERDSPQSLLKSSVTIGAFRAW